MRIGFLGLGQMGAAIAANLLHARHDLSVWNRSAARCAPLLAAGAAAAAQPRAAAVDREVVFSMLADDAALEAVLHGADGLLAGLPAGAVHVSMSTISIAAADRTAASHAARGQGFVCAPVFGRPAAAAAAKLFVLAAGDPAALARVRPLFDAIGQRVFELGPRPSDASLVKLCGNFMILAAVEALGEAMTLAAKGGIDGGLLLEVLTGTLFDAPIYRTYGAILQSGQFKPAGFAAPLGLKDMRLVGQAAEALRVPMPTLSLLRDQLLATIATQGDDVDWSAIARTTARNAGL